MSARPAHPLRTLVTLAFLAACAGETAGPGPSPDPGPGPDPKPQPQENRPPSMSVIGDYDVTAGQRLTLTTTSSDPDGDPITYIWKQLGGPAVGALEGAAPSFDVPDDVVTLRFEVVASDGKAATAPAGIIVRVFEDHTKAVFVATTGSDDNTGSRTAPFRTVQKAIDAAFPLGADVYVGTGTYAGTVAMRDRVSLYGGFDPTWIRDPVAYPTRIDGDRVAMVVDSVGFLSIDGFQVRSADATGATASSVGIRVSGARSVILSRNLIEAGAGAPGLPAGQPAQTASGANGIPGMAGGGCATTRVGGAGGTSTIGSAGGRGGNGGLGGGFAGAKGNGPGAGAGGAAAGAFAPGKSGGAAASPGPSGTNGIGGGELGVLLGYDYQPVPGSPGQPGVRGGGGGGGSGGAGNLIGFCGGGGGGGGAGGAGGMGGTGGTGGGGSFGVIVAVESIDIIIRDNIVRAGPGAAGGAGACGGVGGSGGNGGAGGKGANLVSYNGGAGGAGRDGSFGGNGGGGGGGPSIGILESALSETVLDRNTITAGTGGLGGAGKGPGCVGGNPGSAGRSEPYVKLNL